MNLSLLQQDTIKKGRVDENAAIQLKFEANNDEEYEVEAIQDSAPYEIESKNSHFPWLYYLVS